MNKLMKVLSERSKLIVFLFIFLIPLILVSTWFSEGNILGTAEAEIPFYNLQRPADITRWAWTDIQLGYVSSFIVASNPTWSLLSWIQNQGIEGFIIQAGVFWFLLSVAGIGVYLFSKELFPDIHPLANLSTVIFYWFNPASLANVWNRFLYNFMWFFALLPLASFLFIRGLIRKDYSYSLWTILVILIFSFAMTSFVFILLLWSVFLYTTIFFSIVSKDKNSLFFNIKFFSLTLLLFILFNCWWIFPTFNLFSGKDAFSALTANVFTTEGNVLTLDILSQKLGNIINLSRLMHGGFYNGEGPAWSQNYNIWLISLCLFGLSAFIFWAILQVKKSKHVLYLAIFFILLLFLVKGSNPPFGEVFKFFFTNISPLQVFRNPYEKFGFLLAFIAAPLFGYGIYTLGNYYKKLNTTINILVLTTTLIVLGYPFFSSLVFTGPNYPNNDYSIGFKVEVPDYYKNADDWLLTQGNNFRFIGFPLGGEGITYNWNKGYQGVEASNTLFSTSNILFNTGGWPHYFQLVGRLEELLFKENDFYKIANVINAKYLMVRSDIDFKDRGMRDPSSVTERINKFELTGEFKKVAQFGKLVFWENLKWQDNTVYTANSLVEVSPNALIDDILLPEIDNHIIYDSVPNLDAKNLNTALIIHPTVLDNPDLTNGERRYQFNILEEGDYDLILTNTSWIKSNEISSLGNLKLLVDNNIVSQSAVFREDGKLLVGRFSLKQGLHKITFILPLKNLIKTPDLFTVNNTQSKFSAKINNYDPYSEYYGDFEFLIKQGPGFSFGFEMEDVYDNKLLFSQIVPAQSGFPNWNHAGGIFPIERNPENAQFFVKVDTNMPSEIDYKNVLLIEVPEFSPLLMKKRKDIEFSSPPTVSYKKYSSSKYTVQVTGAQKDYILILSQLYNPGWQAKYQDGQKIDKHLLVNAFANGWIIDKKEDQTITLEFIPQKLLDTGKIVSSLSIAGALIYIGSIILRKRKSIWK